MCRRIMGNLNLFGATRSGFSNKEAFMTITPQQNTSSRRHSQIKLKVHGFAKKPIFLVFQVERFHASFLSLVLPLPKSQFQSLLSMSKKKEKRRQRRNLKPNFMIAFHRLEKFFSKPFRSLVSTQVNLKTFSTKYSKSKCYKQ